GLDGQRNDALADAVQVHGDDDFFLLLVFALFISLFFFGVFLFGVLLVGWFLALIVRLGVFRLFVGLLFLRRAHLFVVALRCHRRRLAFFQHDRIDVARDGVLEAGQIEPSGGKTKVRARAEINVLSVLVEHRKARFTHAVGDLRGLGGIDRVHENRAKVARQIPPIS